MATVPIPLGVRGDRLAAARKRAGLVQVELAAEIDCSRTLITHAEANRVSLSPDRWVQVAQALGVSVDWLAGLTDDPTPAAELTARVAALERRAGGRQQ